MSLPLMQDEEVLWHSGIGKKYKWISFSLLMSLSLPFIALLLFLGTQIGALIVFVLFLLFAVYKQIPNWFISYNFTNERVLIQRGFFNRETISIKYSRIIETSMQQTLIEKWLGIGTISLHDANDHLEGSKSQAATTLEHVDCPETVYIRIQELIEEFEVRNGARK